MMLSFGCVFCNILVLALFVLMFGETYFLCIGWRLSRINFVICECLLFFKHYAKESATKLGNVIETEATTFSRGSPCSVTADDCSKTWQPQTQSLQSVQVSIAIVMYPAAVSLHRDFHQLQWLPYNTMSAELLNFKTGWKSIHGRKLKRMQFFIFFPVKNVSLKENRDNTWSLHVLLAPALFLSRYSGFFPQCRNMPVTTGNCQEVWVWKVNNSTLVAETFLLFHTVLTIPFPPVNRNP